MEDRNSTELRSMSGAGPSMSGAGPLPEDALNVEIVQELPSMPAAGPVQEGAPNVDVVQELPETAFAKLRRLCRAFAVHCHGSLSCTRICMGAFLTIIGIFTVLNSVLHCNKDLEIRLSGFTVRDMVVVHNNSTPWEVTSDINLTLALQKSNPNSWVRPRCDFSLREVELFLRYRDSLISFFELVYIVGDLEPTSSHTVSVTLTGDRYHVSDEAGVALEAQLLRNDSVTFVLNINAWYLLEPGLVDRLVNHKICEVVAKTPQQASMRSGDMGFISAECEEKVMED